MGRKRGRQGRKRRIYPRIGKETEMEGFCMIYHVRLLTTLFLAWRLGVLGERRDGGFKGGREGIAWMG